MKILDRAPMPLSKYALGGKLSQSAWIISLVCQLCQAYIKKKNIQTDRENYMSYRVSLKKRSFTRLAPKPLHKALLVLKMVHNDEDQSKTL